MTRKDKKVKCPICGTYNDKEITIYSDNRHYCKVCYENKKITAEDYKELIKYICELFDMEAPDGWILKQIKEYKEQFKYTYKGIKSTLYYFFEVLEGNTPDDGKGIGIVPFVYKEAKQFYIDKKAIKDNIKDCNIEQLQKDNDIIHINQKTKDEYNDGMDKRGKYNYDLIDISQLGEDE